MERNLAACVGCIIAPAYRSGGGTAPPDVESRLLVEKFCVGSVSDGVLGP